MARALRDIEPGIFHVTAHAVRDTALFRDDLDRTGFLAELRRTTARVGWRCVQFCLMTTHYHLLLEVGKGELPVGMHSLNFRYAVTFNARHDTRGHVLERRYEAKRIESEQHLLLAYRYIARNPVVARMCERPQDWMWSSYRSTIGLAPALSFVDASPILRAFGNIAEFAIARLRAFVEDS